MFSESKDQSIPLLLVSKEQLDLWLGTQAERVKRWAELYRFNADPGKFLRVPDESGTLQAVLVGHDPNIKNMWAFGMLPSVLPTGTYHIEGVSDEDYQNYAIGWGLACYNFDKYKSARDITTHLYVPEEANRDFIKHVVESTFLVRDLINTPTNDMGPSHLADAAKVIAKNCAAKCSVIVGDDLLKHNYPAIHAVGRASNNPPCLIDMQWGDKNAPKLTLVGKGVCFDTGGLDLKSLNNMKLMKKDMGGAAHALGLANLIMKEKLPVRLRVLIPAVENSISDNAYRPSDVIPSRKGSTIEIISTDAEGRVVLSDALYEASQEKPALIVDFATLTGAARVALGTELPALFSNNNEVAHNIQQSTHNVQDPVWHMPLWQDYKRFIESDIADICNTPSVGFGGAISAALFLEHFVDGCDWAHIDLMAWNTSSREGRPKGGEAMGLRGLYTYFSHRFAN